MNTDSKDHKEEHASENDLENISLLLCGHVENLVVVVNVVSVVVVVNAVSVGPYASITANVFDVVALFEIGLVLVPRKADIDAVNEVCFGRISQNFKPSISFLSNIEFTWFKLITGICLDIDFQNTFENTKDFEIDG